MHRFGVVMLVAGGILTVLGLAVGFATMFAGKDELAKLFLGIVPLGFIVGFTGVATTLLFRPHKR